MTAAARPGAEARATGAMLLATLLWGATFVILRDALARVDPIALVCARFTCATLGFAAIVGLGRRRVGARTALWGVLSGLCAAGGYLFQAYGLTIVSAGSSAFLTTAGTLTAGLFAWPLLRQRPAARLGVGLLLAFAGSFLLAGRIHLGLGVGEAWTLVGAVLYALQIVVVAHVADHADPAALAGVQAATVAAVTAPFATHGLAGLASLPPADLARLAYLAVAGSMIAPWLQIRAQRTLPPGRIGLLFAMEPVFAVLFAVGVGGESYALSWWWGALLILAAVALVEWPSASRGAATRPPTG